MKTDEMRVVQELFSVLNKRSRENLNELGKLLDSAESSGHFPAELEAQAKEIQDRQSGIQFAIDEIVKATMRLDGGRPGRTH